MITTVEFASGDTEVSVSIPLIDDVFPEDPESFEVFLSASPGVYIQSPAAATILINDRDPDLPGKTQFDSMHEFYKHNHVTHCQTDQIHNYVHNCIDIINRLYFLMPKKFHKNCDSDHHLQKCNVCS